MITFLIINAFTPQASQQLCLTTKNMAIVEGLTELNVQATVVRKQRKQEGFKVTEFDSNGSSFTASFACGVDANFDLKGNLTFYRDNYVFGKYHPYPIRSATFTSQTALHQLKLRLQTVDGKSKWEISDRKHVVTGNGLESTTGFSFSASPTVDGTPYGPGEIIQATISADTGELQHMKFRQLPQRIEKPSKKLLTPQQAGERAMGFAIRMPRMIQPEVYGKSKLFITADGLNPTSLLNHLNRANPKIVAFKGENVGVYGYAVEIRSGLGVKESLRLGGVDHLFYVIDAQDGSLLVGHGQK